LLCTGQQHIPGMGARIFFSLLCLQSIQHPIHWILGIKWPEHKPELSPPSVAEVQNVLNFILYFLYKMGTLCYTWNIRHWLRSTNFNCNTRLYLHRERYVKFTKWLKYYSKFGTEKTYLPYLVLFYMKMHTINITWCTSSNHIHMAYGYRYAPNTKERSCYNSSFQQNLFVSKWYQCYSSGYLKWSHCHISLWTVTRDNTCANPNTEGQTMMITELKLQ